MMLILACLPLGAAVLTAIELDRELGGRWRGVMFMLSGMWLLMFVAAIDSLDALLGFTGYMLLVVTAVQAVLFVGVLIA